MTVTGTGKYVVKGAAPVTPPPAAGPTYGAGVVAPSGWGTAWRTYRDTGTTSSRREIVVFGDSTTFGSGGLYSWISETRNKAVAYGCTDGGKGMFGGGESLGITYDAPEISGYVTSTFTGLQDAYDSLAGQYWVSSNAGETLTLRFRTTGFRLWYVDRPSDGDFTYSVDGGAPVTVVNTARTSGSPLDRFVHANGFAANTTHQLVITNLGAHQGNTARKIIRVALAPINDVGVAFQKQATSGNTIFAQFGGGVSVTGDWASTRYQAPMGLVPTNGDDIPGPTSADGYSTRNVVDTSYAAVDRVKPILAIFDLAFNDFSGQSNTDFSLYIEGIRKFAAVCRAVGCDGVVTPGNSPVNSNWPTYGAQLFSTMKNQAATEGLAFMDMWQPFGGALAYTRGVANPHLTKPEYVQQGDYVWNALLGV